MKHAIQVEARVSDPPHISVVIPAYNTSVMIRKCLQSLFAGQFQDFECIVVDDGSTDDTVQMAGAFGTHLLSTGGRKGPACARNIGAQAARADILYFIDSDVCVHPDTLERVWRAFSQERDLTALIGSYDASPNSPDFLSQYRNLMHCYMHQSGRETASTFWSGCGAIRRDVFLRYEGFDAREYQRPAIEDIELGYRLISDGHKIVLDRDLQVKHLKHWTFWGLVKTDIVDRGIPLTELILRHSRMPDDLNLKLSQRVSVALVFVLILAAMVIAVQWRAYILTPLFATVLILLGGYFGEVGVRRKRSVIACLAASIAAIVGVSYIYHMRGLIPPVLLAYSTLFLCHRYAHRNPRSISLLLCSMGIYAAFGVLFTVTYLPHNGILLGIFGLLLLIIVLNRQFYLFLAEKRGTLFALAAIPFHLLYHFYNGISFTIGMLRHLRRTLLSLRASRENDLEILGG